MIHNMKWPLLLQKYKPSFNIRRWLHQFLCISSVTSNLGSYYWPFYILLISYDTFLPINLVNLTVCLNPDKSQPDIYTSSLSLHAQISRTHVPAVSFTTFNWSLVGSGNAQRYVHHQRLRRRRRKLVNAPLKVFQKLSVVMFYEEGNTSDHKDLHNRINDCWSNFLNKDSQVLAART